MGALLDVSSSLVLALIVAVPVPFRFFLLWWGGEVLALLPLFLLEEELLIRLIT